MKDPVQEAIAELVFADQLVDEYELHTIEAHDWLTTYLMQRGLDLAAFSSRPDCPTHLRSEIHATARCAL